MNALSLIQNIIKKFWLPGLAVILFLVVALIGNLIQTNKNKPVPSPIPAPPKIYQNPLQKKPQKYDFSNINKLSAPTQLPVYTANLANPSEADFGDVAKLFNFTGSPTDIPNTNDGTLHKWADKERSLNIGNTSIYFKNDSTEIPTKSLTENQLQTEAQDLIKKIKLLPSDLILDPQGTSYTSYENNYFKSQPSFDKAQFVEFSFNSSLSGYPIINSGIKADYTLVKLRKDGEIMEFQSKYFGNFQSIGTFALKTAEAAESNIDNGTIINAYLPDANGQAIDMYRVQAQDISVAQIDKVSLAYFMPLTPTQNIIPVYVFEGNFKTTNNKVGRIKILVPSPQNL